MPHPDERAVQIRLGEAIRMIRADRGMTQEDLAEASGLHPRYISDVERGRRNPGILNVVRIAAALDQDVGTLVAGLPRLGPRGRADLPPEERLTLG